ncbi:cobalamin-binding protein [Marinospirillum insulare]|uniref:Cobalamin-binding protein n=1 Tax=Marinospirillum insulare TaxID=217169 RepID=A0ABQ6A1A3_9GAMM|nr:cobalamin-binding protein [Marinospirillum insulare]GLR65067.1 cobalamin-binding protein [Marinospirillum insulare]
MRLKISLPFVFLLWLVTNLAYAAVEVTDDSGQLVHLAKPAQRIISLSPHLTENLFATGAGDLIVGTVEYSDYPAAAKQIPLIGGYNQLDIEGILALEPDLILAWHSGNPLAQVERLAGLGIPVYYSEPRSLAGVSHELRQLGRLTGREATAEQAAQAFDAGAEKLKKRYAQQREVRVFYQVWEQPLITLNGEHLISEGLSLCGGVNVFADLKQLVPVISREAVLEQDPEVIMGGGIKEGEGEKDPAWLIHWQKFTAMQAVKANKLYFIPPSLVQRPTPRFLEGTQIMCDKLQQARNH